MWLHLFKRISAEMQPVDFCPAVTEQVGQLLLWKRTEMIREKRTTFTDSLLLIWKGEMKHFLFPVHAGHRIHVSKLQPEQHSDGLKFFKHWMSIITIIFKNDDHLQNRMTLLINKRTSYCFYWYIKLIHIETMILMSEVTCSLCVHSRSDCQFNVSTVNVSCDSLVSLQRSSVGGNVRRLVLQPVDSAVCEEQALRLRLRRYSEPSSCVCVKCVCVWVLSVCDVTCSSSSHRSSYLTLPLCSVQCFWRGGWI